MVYLFVFYLVLFSFGFQFNYLSNPYDEFRLLQLILASFSIFFLLKNIFIFKKNTIFILLFIYLFLILNISNFNVFEVQDVLMWLSLFLMFLSLLEVDFQSPKIQYYLSILVLGSVIPLFFIFLFIYDFLVLGVRNDWGVYYGSIRVFDSFVIPIFWLAFFLLKQENKIIGKVYFYTVLLIGLALLFNGARSALLSMVLPLLLLWIIKKDYRSLVCKSAIPLVFSFSLYNFIYFVRNFIHANNLDTNIARLSTSRRYEIWMFMYEKWKQNFFVGLGGGFLAKEQYVYGNHAHSLWFRLIFEWGVFGFILIFFILHQTYVLFRSKADPILKMGVFSILIDATFSGNFIYPASQMSCILFLACAFSYIKENSLSSQSMIASKILILLYVLLFFYIILNFFWMDVSCFGCMSSDGRLAPFFWEYGGSSHLK